MSRVSVMPAALVVGALTVHILGMKILSTSKGCYDNLEECIAEHNLCRKEGNPLKSMCGTEGGFCQLEDPEACNMTIRFLFSGISMLRECFCQWEEEPCTLLHLLAAYCQQHLDDGNSSAKMSWTPQTLIQKSAPASLSCLHALQACQNRPNCASAYETMRALCPMDGTNCMVASPLCLSLWEELRRSPLGRCTCNKGRRKCLALWHFIHENPCVLKVLEGQDLYMTTLDQNSQQRISEQKTFPKMKWADSGLSGYVPGMSHSCSGQMEACLEHKACNKWLLPVVQACPASQCNQSQCGLRIQQFYEGMPQTMAETLVFCTCEPEDWKCQVARATLHGDMCEVEQDWTCLEMMDSCLESQMCREKFGTLLSMCLGMESVGNDGDALSEWVDFIDYELSWSQDRECRMALVASMGTTLQQPCSCDGLPTHYLHKCNKLHQLLHNKSMFSNYVAVTRAPEQSLKANEQAYAQWWLSDDVLYTSVYTTLCTSVIMAILGVVIIVSHKLRLHKKATDQLGYGTPPQKNSGTDVQY